MTLDEIKDTLEKQTAAANQLRADLRQAEINIIHLQGMLQGYQSALDAPPQLVGDLDDEPAGCSACQ